MYKGLFLDRDGVVNHSVIRYNKPYAPLNIKQVKIIPAIKNVIKFAKKNGFKVFIITNQPDVSRGLTKKEKVEEINKFINKELCDVDYIFTCYHDNQDQCECRKPKPGAFIALSQKYNIDLTKSIMVGDRAKDIEAAKNANCSSVFIDYGYNEIKPTDQTYTINAVDELLCCLKKHFEQS